MHWNNDYKAWICTGLEYQEVCGKVCAPGRLEAFRAGANRVASDG
jgi:hypothetical protein